MEKKGQKMGKNKINIKEGLRERVPPSKHEHRAQTTNTPRIRGLHQTSNHSLSRLFRYSVIQSFIQSLSRQKAHSVDTGSTSILSTKSQNTTASPLRLCTASHLQTASGKHRLFLDQKSYFKQYALPQNKEQN